MLFPHLVGLRVGRVIRVGRAVRIEAAGLDSEAACPGCGVIAGRVHSRYERRLSDLAVAGQELILTLRVRRFFCGSAECSRKTFAEQFPNLTVRYGRHTLLLSEALLAIGLALGGRPGARLASRLAIGVSRIFEERRQRQGTADLPGRRRRGGHPGAGTRRTAQHGPPNRVDLTPGPESSWNG